MIVSPYILLLVKIINSFFAVTLHSIFHNIPDIFTTFFNLEKKLGVLWFALFPATWHSQQPGQNVFQITIGDGILPCMSRDFVIFMPKHLAEYYL